MKKVKLAQNFLPYFVQYHQPLSSLINMSAKDFKGVNKHRTYEGNINL
jgi:hypothetical protein